MRGLWHVVQAGSHSGAADQPAAEHIDLVTIAFIQGQSQLTQFKLRATLEAPDLRITPFPAFERENSSSHFLSSSHKNAWELIASVKTVASSLCFSSYMCIQSDYFPLAVVVT